jgi:hypothetical protein
LGVLLKGDRGGNRMATVQQIPTISSVHAPQLEYPPQPTDHDPVVNPQNSGIGFCTKSSSTVGDNAAGAEGGANERRTFVPSSPKSARTIFIQFLQEFLCIDFRGFQSGFGKHPDLILFAAPSGSTLAVPTSVMLEPREQALEIIQEKIAANELRFGAASQ